MKNPGLAMIVAFIIATFAPFSNNGIANQHKENTGDVVYIDVNIDQPNVEDCYDDDTSVFDHLEQDWLKIFPNPNEGVFNLEIRDLTQAKFINVFIFNSLGEKVYQSEHESLEGKLTLELNLVGLPKGVYYVRIETDIRTGVEQLLIF